MLDGDTDEILFELIAGEHVVIDTFAWLHEISSVDPTILSN